MTFFLRLLFFLCENTVPDNDVANLVPPGTMN
jgi:hypothetical protein